MWAEEVVRFLGSDPANETNLSIAIGGHPASLNADTKMALEGNSSAHTGVLMEGIRNKACGLDIHKKFIAACIKDLQGVTLEARYDRTPKDLLRLKEWIVENNCDIVACESTSDFWVQVYEMLEGHIELIVGNARDIKAISHKKTDKVDAAWAVYLKSCKFRPSILTHYRIRS